MFFRRKKSKSKSKSKKVAIAKSNTAVVKLQKQINKINKALKTTYETMYLYGNFSNTTVSTDYAYQNLCNYSTLAPCFGTAGNDYNFVNQFMARKLELDVAITAGSEPNNIYMTVYLVTLKSAATSLYSKTTGVLTLASPANYVTNAVAGISQAMINPKDFNIHYKRRIVIGNNAQAIGAPSGAGNDFVQGTWRKKINVTMKQMVKNPDGNVVSLTCNQEASKQWYLLVFNDNNTVDLEYPYLYINAVWTIDVPV